MTIPDDTARHRVEGLRRFNPAAHTLAVLAATAVRVEPALLRRLRLLIADADVGAESDLWSSGLLASASPLGISFEPECAELLRAELGGPAYEPIRRRALELIETAHAELHWSLRLEETINQLMLGPSPDLDRAETLLHAAIGRLRHADDDEADQVRVARWLLAALGRIPARLRATPTGVAARIGAGVRLDGRWSGPSAEPAGVEPWMRWLLDLAGIRERRVMVRLDPGALVLNGTGPDCAEIRIPGTNPMVLRLTWNDGRLHRRRVEFHPGRAEFVPLRADQVEIRDVTGAGYLVARPSRGLPGLRPPDGLDFSARRAALRPCLGRSAELELIGRAVRHENAQVITIVGLAGMGKTVLLGAALDDLEEQGYAVASHFYGAEPRWDAPQTVATSLMAQIRGAVTAPPAPPAWEGRRRALVITAGSYQDPAFAEVRPVGGDAGLLVEALGDPVLCGFDVELLSGADSRTVAHRLASFFDEADPGDLLLVYLATHAIDLGSETIYATSDTDMRNPQVTGISSRLLGEMLQRSSARSMVLLDCCQIGTSVDQTERPPVLGQLLSPPGAGTVISARTRAEYLIGKKSPARPLSAGPPVPFARVVAEGLRSGGADLDGDGAVTADELSRYLLERLPGTEVAADFYGRASVLARRPVERRPLSLKLAGDGRIPSSFLESAGAGPQGIVIALDGLPEPLDEFLRAVTPLPSSLPPNVHVIATLRDDADLRVGRSLSSDAFPITLGPDSAEEVCHALVDYHAADLARAFGHPDAGPGLIRAAGGVPGHLAALIEWTFGVPPRTARMDALPPLAAMATDEFWQSLEGKLLDLLLLIVAARPGLTVQALTAAANMRPADVRSQATQLVRRRLVALTGEIGEAGAVVAAGAGQVATEAVRRYPERVTQAHRRHAAAFPFDEPRSALPYQVETVAFHAARGGDATLLGRVVRCGELFDLRRRRSGTGPLLDDLAALASAEPSGAHGRTADRIRRALSGLAGVIREAPEFFVDLLRGRLVTDGNADTAADVFGGCPPAALTVRDISAVGGPSFTVLESRPVRGAARHGAEIALVLDAQVRWFPSRASTPHHQRPSTRVVGVAESGGHLAVATASSLTVVAAAPVGTARDIDLGPATVTALLGGASVHLGLADGRVLEFPPTARGSVPARRLVGHSGPVTALASSPEAVLSAGADGTVRVWPPLGESPARYTYRGHGVAVTALAEVRPGWILSGDAEGALRLWAAGHGAERTMPPSHLASITVVLAVPGGMVSADADGAVQAWEWDGSLTVRPGRRLRVPGGEPVRRMAAGAGLLAVATAAGTIHWLALGAGVVLRTIEAGDEVHEVAFDADGGLLVAHDRGLVRYEPVPADQEPGRARYRSALAVDRAGAAVLAGMPTGVATVRGGKVVAADFGGDPAVSAAWTADGTAVTVRGSGRAHVGAGVDRDGRFSLAEAGERGSWFLRADGEIRQVTRDGSRVVSRADHDAEATAFAVDETGIGTLAVGYADGRVRLSRLDGRTLAPVLTGGGRVLDLAAVKGRVIGLSADGTLFRIEPGGPQSRLARHEGATGIACTAGEVVSCSTDGTLRLWDIADGALLGVVAGRLPFAAVAASPPGEIVARDATDRIWYVRARPA